MQHLGGKQLFAATVNSGKSNLRRHTLLRSCTQHRYEKSLSVATENNTQPNQRVYTRSMSSTRTREIRHTKQQQSPHHTPKSFTLSPTYIHTSKNTH